MSAIDATKPVTGSPTTESVRANFTAAKSEIEALETGKAPLASPTFTGTATFSGLSVSGTAALTTFSLGGSTITSTAAEINKLDGVTATTEEINYLLGVSSNIQTQLDSKSEGGGEWGGITGTLSNQTDLQSALNTKQVSLISGSNIKTINSQSLLGSGNLAVGTLSDYQEFTTSGTWSKPAGATWVYVEIVSAGGGGAATASTNPVGGGGGGLFMSKLYRSTSLASSVSVVIGAGGLGKTTAGDTGGSTYFGGLVAYGGAGGQVTTTGVYLVAGNTTYHPTYTTNSLAGVSVVRALTGDTFGFGGCLDTPGGKSTFGGAGGGGAGTSSSSGGSSQLAGDGGAGAIGSLAGSGSYPGGGGGAASDGGTAGNGAAGRVRVWAW